MLNRMMRGALAGVVGTMVLDVATYADMALRGRGSSATAAALVGVLTNRMG